jgi:hypothetical protein
VEGQREQSRLVFNKALLAGTSRAFNSLNFNQLQTRFIVYPKNTQVKLFLLLWVLFGYIIIAMNKKRGRPAKEADHLRNDKLLVRVESDEKEAFQDAANLAGISLSSWVRERLRRVALRELQEAARPIPFIR